MQSLQRKIKLLSVLNEQIFELVEVETEADIVWEKAELTIISVNEALANLIIKKHKSKKRSLCSIIPSSSNFGDESNPTMSRTSQAMNVESLRVSCS